MTHEDRGEISPVESFPWPEKRADPDAGPLGDDKAVRTLAEWDAQAGQIAALRRRQHERAPGGARRCRREVGDALGSSGIGGDRMTLE